LTVSIEEMPLGVLVNPSDLEKTAEDGDVWEFKIYNFQDR